MTRSALGGLFLLGAVCTPAVAAAQTGLRLDDHLVLEYHLDNGDKDPHDDHYGTGIERLTLSGNAENLNTFAQVDAEAFYDPHDARHVNTARLARIGMDYTLGDVTVTAGDFHRQLGRGIILSLRKVDELGVDTTLQGGRVAWAPEGHEVDVFAGRTNVSGFDTPTEFAVPQTHDVIAGGAYTARMFDTVHFGTYAYTERLRLAQDPSAGFDHTSASGAFFELPDVADVLAVYGEADWQGRKRGEDRSQGKAGYLTLDLNAAGFSVLLEGLYIDDIMVRGTSPGAPAPLDYANPPTLERLDQEVDTTTDTEGGRARVSYGFLDGDLAPYVSVLVRKNEPKGPAPVDVIHTYGGFDWAYGGGASRLGASGGYRRFTQKGEVFKDIKHVEADWLQNLPGGHALHVSGNEEFRMLEGKDYMRGTTIIGVERQRLGGVSVEVGDDTQNPHVRNYFFAGIITWKAAEWAELRATGGSERGGLKCVGGVCRDFPAFTGGKLEATFRHDLM